MVVSDHFSSRAESYTIPNIDATTVASTFVEEFVCRYGVPMEFPSDNMNRK